MVDGFFKVAAVTPRVKVADCEFNKKEICKYIEEANKREVKLIVFPELSLTGYTCGDLFLQDLLLKEAKKAMQDIKEYAKAYDMLVVVGLPYLACGKLFNVACVLYHGQILGMIPKTNLPNYTEFYEARHFSPGNEVPFDIDVDGVTVPFGVNQLFQAENMEAFCLGIEICEDLWVPQPPSGRHAATGATVIANLSASNELTGKVQYRRELVKGQSARLVSGYIYADAGVGESSTDLVYSGHCMICENNSMLAESKMFQEEMIISELDLYKFRSERQRMGTFPMPDQSNYVITKFLLSENEDGTLLETKLTRKIPRAPFVPSNSKDRNNRCREIIDLQAAGLRTRLQHIGCKTCVLGISGGLDSTLALLVTARAFDLLKLDRKGILAVTMPCFGTTDRTYQNAVKLTNYLGATLIEVPIRDSVTQHFKDIGQDMENHDITYENGQARERTQVLMDIANKYNGIVVGTGDMSELALGWATYNGDHMSMYGVNCSVPKTLVRYLVTYFSETESKKELCDVLKDIVDTPVSPELIPPKDGEISQKTEDIVGPYELHDFFLYYILRYGYEPKKVYRLAKLAFHGEYSNEIILKWLKNFYRRFFAQQFKRSCLPDGPKVGSVSVSPRGDLRMPSDASAHIWMKQLEEIQES